MVRKGQTLMQASYNVMHCRILKFGIWWIQKLCCFIKKSKIVELEMEERKITAKLSLKS